MGRTASTAKMSLKGAGLIMVVNVGLSILALVVLSVGFVAALGLLMLVESAALMLLGGALSFSGQAGVRRLVGVFSGTETKVSKTDLEDLDAKAAGYALMGVTLFVGSMALAAATF